MLLFLVCIAIICAAFCYLFFAPFYVEINSVKEILGIRFHKLAMVDLCLKDSTLLLEIRIMGWIKRIDLFAKKKVKKEKLEKKKTGSKKKSRKIPWRRILGVLKSFRVSKCEVVIDTGDVRTNGILYPVFYMAGFYTKKNIRINFVDENILIVEIENSLARMSWAFISS